MWRCAINACDAGREGELIFTYIYELSKSKIPVKRLWMLSMTTTGPSKKPHNNSDPVMTFKALQDAARCRSESDWLVGINGTRAVTIKRSKSRSRQVFHSRTECKPPTLLWLLIVNWWRYAISFLKHCIKSPLILEFLRVLTWVLTKDQISKRQIRTNTTALTVFGKKNPPKRLWRNWRGCEIAESLRDLKNAHPQAPGKVSTT